MRTTEWTKAARAEPRARAKVLKSNEMTAADGADAK
jgi:hypothetical protein